VNYSPATSPENLLPYYALRKLRASQDRQQIFLILGHFLLKMTCGDLSQENNSPSSTKSFLSAPFSV